MKKTNQLSPKKIVLLFFLSCLIAQGQKSDYPRVQIVEQHSAFFTGYLNNEAVVFYLEAWGSENMFQDYQELQGWFKKVDDSQQVEVHGILTSDDFLLFSGERLHDSLMNGISDYHASIDYQHVPEITVWEMADALELAEGEYKFKKVGKETHAVFGDDSLDLNLFFEGYKLNRRQEFLILSEEEAIDLYALDLEARNYTVMASGDGAILLRYFYTSNNWNPMGRCGAGYELGLYVLHFNEEGLFLNSEHFPIESCWTGILAELELVDTKLKLEYLDNELQEALFIDLKAFEESPDTIYSQLMTELDY